jgi:hypothetical protein
MKVASSAIALVPLVLGVIIGVSKSGGATAEEIHAYLMAANDGYGLADCLNEGGECGQVVADAFCEAQGRGSAVSFGPQSRFTGAEVRISTTAEPYVVNCRD